MAKKHIFRWLQIKDRPKGHHNFAFYILIFDFPPHLPLMSLSASTYVLTRLLYNCKETFTDVMKTLQIKLFMQNKANFRKVKLNVTKVLARVYGQMDTWSIRKNEPKTNPIKANSKPIQSQTNPILPSSPLRILQLFAVGGRTEKIMSCNLLNREMSVQICLSFYCFSIPNWNEPQQVSPDPRLYEYRASGIWYRVRMALPETANTAILMHNYDSAVTVNKKASGKYCRSQPLPPHDLTRLGIEPGQCPVRR